MKTITEHLVSSGLFPSGCRVLAAVSGGADSMCLLHALWTMREKLGIEVTAAHYDHGLRGEESLRDHDFVEQYCEREKIPFVSEHGDVASYAAEHRLGIEEAARVLRYEFLERKAQELACGRIAVAHHLEDNAETILLHLVRGSGAAGLSGMSPLRGKIARPLLDISRRQIEQYLAGEKVPYMEDSSNASDEYTRNYLRHRILPLLRELNPEADRAICRAGRSAGEDEACLSAETDAFLKSQRAEDSLPCRELLALPDAVSSRVIRRMCPQAISYEHVQAVRKIARSTEPAFADVPGLRIRAERGRLTFAPAALLEKLPERPLIPGESLSFPEAGWVVRTEICSFQEEVHGLFNICYLKCGEIYGQLSVGPRRAGDRISLYGRGCSKTLKSLYTEHKLTQAERLTTPVLRDEKGVLAVAGLARSTRAVPEPGDPVIRVEFMRM